MRTTVVGAVLMGAGTAAGADRTSAGDTDAIVTAAVMEAVQQRLGRDVTVTLEDMRWSIPSASIVRTPAAVLSGDRGDVRPADAPSVEDLVATPDPLARIGQRVRFTLVGRRAGRGPTLVRLGEATAIVMARGTVARLTAAVARGEVVPAPLIEAADMTVADVPLRRWPSPEEVAGGRAARPLAAGHAVAFGDVADAVTIRSGDHVRVTARVAGAAVATIGVAEQAGMMDQVIRVMNVGSRRAVRARVVASGEVEVIDAR